MGHPAYLKQFSVLLIIGFVENFTCYFLITKRVLITGIIKEKRDQCRETYFS
jgi:hypothetical protein